MKKTATVYSIIALALLCCIAPAVFPQENPAPPLQHKKKVFIDEKKQDIYWPMSMPFWVKLTASPGENAPSYLLRKVHPKSALEAEQYLKNGISLEITGRQFIRWYNVHTDEFVFLKFFADGDAPVTEETLDGAPFWTVGQRLFYGKGLVCSLSARDEVSGVDRVYLSVDGGEFLPYNNEIAFDKEKDYFLRFYAVDRVGYAGEPKTLRFTVDTTPPETLIQPRTNFFQTVLSPLTTLRLTAEDKTAGIKNIFYRIDTQPEPAVYIDKDIKLADLSDGEHKVEYYSIDNVLNPEDKKIYTFYLDRTPPETESAFVGDHYHEKGTDFISPRTGIELSARDNKIGVEQMEYAFEEGRYQVYSAPFTTPYKAGKHTVTYRAVDKLNNMGPVKKIPVFLDNKPPKSTHTITGAKFDQRDTTWITSRTTIQLSAADDASGVGGVYFQLGENKEYRLYSDPISIAQEGRYLFKFYGTDRVENRETEQPYILIVDNSPPTLMKTFSVPKSGTTPGKDGIEIDVYPRYTSIFFGAVDNSAGIAGICYSLNGGKEVRYSTPLAFNDAGDFSLEVRLMDNVGNTNVETVRFVIRD